MDSTFAYSTVGRLPLRGRTFDEAVDAAMQQDKPPNAAAQADCSHDLLPVSRTHSRCMNCDALVLTPNAVLSGCPPTTDQNSGGPSGQSA
jgi:hypothetical protein